MRVVLRPARAAEIPALNALIQESARALSRGFYTRAEIESAARHVFGVDSALIEDGTYFVVEVTSEPAVEGELAACGGWSRRRALYGGDQRKVGAPRDPVERLDPAVDAARIRAFFVAPRWARHGLGRRLLEACTDAARAEGFRALELMATLPGVPFYAAAGFVELEHVSDRLPDGVAVRFVRMRKEI